MESGMVYNIQRMSTKDGPDADDGFSQGVPPALSLVQQPDPRASIRSSCSLRTCASPAGRVNGSARMARWLKEAAHTTGSEPYAKVAGTVLKFVPPRPVSCPVSV